VQESGVIGDKDRCGCDYAGRLFKRGGAGQVRYALRRSVCDLQTNGGIPVISENDEFFVREKRDKPVKVRPLFCRAVCRAGTEHDKPFILL
jgi:hypothetical protein